VLRRFDVEEGELVNFLVVEQPDDIDRIAEIARAPESNGLDESLPAQQEAWNHAVAQQGRRLLGTRCTSAYYARALMTPAVPATVVLFTAGFPYGPGETSFLQHELPALLKHFERIVLVPGAVEGPRELVSDRRVEVDLSYSSVERLAHRTNPFRVFFSAPMPHELWDLLAEPRVAALMRSVRYLARAQRVAAWIDRLLVGQDPTRIVLYSYWLSHQALGACLAKRRRPGLCAVSRVHGYDLYFERHVPPYLPFRTELLSRLDKVFTVSHHGLRYLLERYPWAEKSLALAHLGVPDPGGLAHRSADGAVRVLSCSAVSAVKRVDRILAALRRLAAMRAPQRIIWTHLGDGEESMALRAHVAHVTPSLPNLEVHLPGLLPWQGVLEHYRKHPVDVFVNTSSSEGMPVAIMEALSHGVPVVAPAVGGVSEIVSQQTGRLMSEHPAPDEIAQALAEVVDSDQPERLRSACRALWATRFDARTNCDAFARELRGLRDKRSPQVR
jgi:glycosyltransferase involved in cell wall biosynthesis